MNQELGAKSVLYHPKNPNTHLCDLVCSICEFWLQWTCIYVLCVWAQVCSVHTLFNVQQIDPILGIFLHFVRKIPSHLFQQVLQ